MIVNTILELTGEIIRLDNAFPRPSGWQWFNLLTKDGHEYHISGKSNTYISVGMMVSCKVVDMGYDTQWHQHLCELKDNVEIQKNTKESMIRYLTSNLFQGIGRKTAEKLYDAFGEHVVEMLMNDMDTVAKKVKLTPKQKASLSDIGKYNLILAMQKRFPHLSLDAVQEAISAAAQFSNVVRHYERAPLSLAELKSVSFAMMDDVLIYDLQISLHDFDRLNFVFSHYVPQVLRKTHNTYLSTKEEWDMLTKEVFKRPMPVNFATHQERGQWVFAMANILTKKHVDYLRQDVRSNGDLHLYTKKMLNAKHYLEDVFFAYLTASPFDRKMWKKLYDKTEIAFQNWVQQYQSVLTDEQQSAILKSVTHNISFISGGPGRGKTYVTKYLLNFWNQCVHGDIIMLAPTGRAVNKLKTETGYHNVETIARCACMNRGNRQPQVFIDNAGVERPVGLKTLVLIDEVSMLNLFDASDIFQIFKGCTIVFLGDINQLQPIEPGSFLHTVLEIHQVYPFPISYLTKNLRTGKQVLADNADKILDGTLSGKDYHLDFAFDFTFAGIDHQGNRISATDADEITRAKALDYYQDGLKNGLSYSDILLMSPARKGPAGTESLNQHLQENLNPKSASNHTFFDNQNRKCISIKGMVCPGVRIDGMEIRILDRIMQTVNNAEMPFVYYKDNDPDSNEITDKGCGFFNGDTGTIVRYIFPQGGKPAFLLLQMDDGRFFEIAVTADACKELTLAYAITIHKSQGSEAALALVVLPEDLAGKNQFLATPFLTKNLLYTAVTRAKQSVQILGSKQAMTDCLSTVQYSGASTVGVDTIERITKQLATGSVKAIKQ